MDFDTAGGRNVAGGGKNISAISEYLLHNKVSATSCIALNLALHLRSRKICPHLTQKFSLDSLLIFPAVILHTVLEHPAGGVQLNGLNVLLFYVNRKVVGRIRPRPIGQYRPVFSVSRL